PAPAPPVLPRASLHPVRSVSRALSGMAAVALDALAALDAGKALPPPRSAEALLFLDEADVPRAEVRIALTPAVRKLVLAARRLDRLGTESPADWNAALEKEVAAAKRKPF
ncbi:MAG TPA: hypothetical protein PK598_15645, partial [Thermoanaerobaculia bacterium]|nr:hypothetical protein [Thermoanaerobaculia bacterium]